MIQRIQSIFLFLATGVLSAFSFLRPSSLLVMDNGIAVMPAIASITSAVIALVAIFLFKNRKMQKMAVFVALLSSLVAIGALFAFYDWQSVIRMWPIYLIPVGTLLLLLAKRGIDSDEKLIKSLDRLR